MDRYTLICSMMTELVPTRMQSLAFFFVVVALSKWCLNRHHTDFALNVFIPRVLLLQAVGELTGAL